MSEKNSHKKSKSAHKLKKESVKKVDKTIEISGVAISSSRKDQVLRKMWLQRREMLHVATVNPEFIMEARTNPRFKDILARCLCVADGHGVVRASKKQVERISGSELVGEILQRASERGEKIFLLGARAGVAERAASEMRKKYPGLQVEWYEGAKSVKVEKSEEASMTIAKINSISPDYLLVAYGSPWQDIWIEDNRPYLRVRVAMGIGGVLDEWAGEIALCPEWIDRVGFKWLWRVVHEPRRWRRIMKALQFEMLFVWKPAIIGLFQNR